MQGVIFDKDGIIFPTEEINQECWVKAAQTITNTSYDDTVFHCVLGVSKQRGNELLLNSMGSDFPIEAVRNAKEELFEHYMTENRIDPKTGVVAFLELLKESKIPIALATSCHRTRTEQQLKGAGIVDFFDVIVCSDDHISMKSKPHPDIFEKAAEMLGIEIDDVKVFEDSFAGVVAAYLSGASVIHVRDILEPNNCIKNLADFCLPSLEGIEVRQGELDL